MSAGIGHGVDRYGAVAEQLSNPSVKMNQLIQYAQGTNPLVPSFMALAEIQNRQNAVALQPGQSSPTTVQQDLIAKAESPAPMGMPSMAPQQAPQGVAGLQPPQGVAALPSGMGGQSFAGGGIVAFDEGSKDAVQDPYAALSFEDKLKSLRAAEDQDTDLSKNAMFRRNMSLPNMPSMGSFSRNLSALSPAKSTDADAQAGGFYGGGKAPTLTPDELGRFVAPPSDKGPSDSPKIPSKPAADLPTKDSSAKEDMYSKYEKMFMEQNAESKTARQQDKYMRLLEAGLGIMGGTSPYAMANIGQGAMGAAKGYAQDKAAFAKEDRDNIKELMGLGLKKEEAIRENEKLSIMRKEATDKGGYYGAYADYLKSGKGAGEAANTRLSIAQQGLVHKYFQDLKKDMNNYGVSDDVLMQKAMSMAGAQGGGGAPAPTTVQWGSLGAPTKP